MLSKRWETVKRTPPLLKRRFALAANMLGEQTAQLKEQAAQIRCPHHSPDACQAMMAVPLDIRLHSRWR
jgi:hypothetical protein